jgi:hypothetical protein
MNLQKEAEDIDAWLNNPRNAKHVRDKSLNEINKLLTLETTTEASGNIAFELSFHKFWSVNQLLAQLYIQKDKTLVMNMASKVSDYSYYITRIYISIADHPDGKVYIPLLDIEHLFFHLLAFNRHEQALWLGGRTYLGDNSERFSGSKNEVWTLREVSEWESLGGDEVGWRSIVTKLRRLIPGQKEKECSAGKLPDDPMFPYWQEKPLCGYMLRLWLVMSGQITPEEVPAGHPQCGVYEGLFQHWNDPIALERSIIEACDYHVSRSSEDGDGDYDIPEFTLRPYNVIPFEIIAYRNVRKRMGLETSWPAHPLLESPFVKNLPDELPPSDDPLLKEVLEAVRKVLPEV